MHDWFVYLLLGVVCVAAAVRLLRRRPAMQPAQFANEPALATGPELDAHSEPYTPAPSPHQPPMTEQASIVVTACQDAPNTKIMPFAEDMPVAMLQFEGKHGQFPLRRGEVVIGRHSEDDVRIVDVRVSRHHARLVVRDDGGSEIENLTAARAEPNMMLVNGVSANNASIKYGDIVTLGGVSFRYQQAVA
ncbi:MAG: FHA domain-containing protein [Hyphomicrobiaceae bacterium]